MYIADVVSIFCYIPVTINKGYGMLFVANTEMEGLIKT